MPATPTLANLLDAVSHPEATATLKRAAIACQAIRVRPGIDLPRLEKALARLVGRHEGLGSHFAREDGQWRILTSAAPAPLSVLDMAGASEADLAAKARDIADRPYDLGVPSLFETHLLRLGQGGDVVMVRLFEGIADGWSLGIVLDELLKAYIGLDLGPRPLGLGQVMRLSASSAPAAYPGPVDPARLKLGPSRVRTLQLRGADTLRRRAMALGTTENGLLAAAFALALAEAGHGAQARIGTYDPARRDPRLHRAVGFLSRLVALELPPKAEVVPLARRLDAQFLDLGGKPEILGAVPDFIYAPLLPRQMLDQSLFGSAMRKFSKGQIAMMSFDVEALDVAPGGLQEGRLQLRPLALEDRLELRFQYDLASFGEAEIAALARSVIEHAGLPAAVVIGDSLGEVFAAAEDRVALDGALAGK